MKIRTVCNCYLSGESLGWPQCVDMPSFLGSFARFDHRAIENKLFAARSLLVNKLDVNGITLGSHPVLDLPVGCRR